MHARTRTPTVYIPLFPLCRWSRQYLSDTLPPLSLVEARLAQVSVAKNKQNKTNVGCYLFVNFCFFKSKQRVQFGILPGTKTSQQVKVPSLFFFHSSSSIKTVWPLGENRREEGAGGFRGINPQRLEQRTFPSSRHSTGIEETTPARLKNSGQHWCLCGDGAPNPGMSKQKGRTNNSNKKTKKKNPCDITTAILNRAAF